MLDISDVFALLKDEIAPIHLEKDSRALQDSVGYILAENIYATIDLPPFDNSAMDGYAVLNKDIDPDKNTVLPCQEYIPAGDLRENILEAGKCCRIFTGAPVPQNCDRVIPQEETQQDPAGNIIFAPSPFRDHIRTKGGDIKEAELALAKGTQIKITHLPLLASLGLSEIEVKRPLKIALLISGDELVTVGKPLRYGEIYNSNGVFLPVLLQNIVPCFISTCQLKDDYKQTKAVVAKLSEECDFIISSGGVSVGDEDHLGKVFAELGELKINKIAFKPGKPFTFATFPSCYAIGLPGNPYSAFVCTTIFVRYILLQSYGCDFSPAHELMFKVKSNFEHKGSGRIEMLKVQYNNGALNKMPQQGSGHVQDIANASGLAMIPQHTEIKVGDDVYYLPLESLYKI